MEIPITSGGPAVVVAVPAGELLAELVPDGELLAELEHAASNSAAAEHATAVQPDRFMVFIIRFPHVLGCAAGVGTRVSRRGRFVDTLPPEREHCYRDSTRVPSPGQRLIRITAEGAADEDRQRLGTTRPGQGRGRHRRSD